jgi:hypothetical protein
MLHLFSILRQPSQSGPREYYATPGTKVDWCGTKVLKTWTRLETKKWKHISKLVKCFSSRSQFFSRRFHFVDFFKIESPSVESAMDPKTGEYRLVNVQPLKTFPPISFWKEKEKCNSLGTITYRHKENRMAFVELHSRILNGVVLIMRKLLMPWLGQRLRYTVVVRHGLPTLAAYLSTHGQAPGFTLIMLRP